VTTRGVEPLRDKGDEPRKTQVFISYARADGAFADSLAAVLESRGFAILIDRSDIYAFEECWKRIADGPRSSPIQYRYMPD
jgi:hypothetical protein